MPAVIGIVVVVVFWRFLVLVAGEAFIAAGLPPRAARFQARSALTGAGYTTSESETVVNDPPSRRAASMLFLVGYAGPITVLGLLGFGFLVPTANDLEVRSLVLVGLLVLFAVLERLGVNETVGRGPARFVARRIGAGRTGEVWTRLGDHAIASVDVAAGSRLAGRAVAELPTADSITVFTIGRKVGSDLHYLTGPEGTEVIQPGDELLVFARQRDIDRLRAEAA